VRGLGPSRTMTTQRGHRQLPTDGRSSPASPLSRSATGSTGPTAQPPPHDDDQVEADPAAGPARPVPASRARLQPRADDAPSWTRRATTPTPAIPAVRLPAPPPRPTTSFPSDTTDTGGRTLAPGRSDARTGHRSLGQALRDTGRPHRTPDAGQERGHGDDSTAGVRTSLAATPSDRTLRRPTVFALPLPAGSAGQAAPRRTAVLGRLRVQRRANGEASSVMATGVRDGKQPSRLSEGEVGSDGVLPASN
jgi:hypothetical protein